MIATKCPTDTSKLKAADLRIIFLDNGARNTVDHSTMLYRCEKFFLKRSNCKIEKFGSDGKQLTESQNKRMKSDLQSRSFKQTMDKIQSWYLIRSLQNLICSDNAEFCELSAPSIVIHEYHKFLSALGLLGICKEESRTCWLNFLPESTVGM